MSNHQSRTSTSCVILAGGTGKRLGGVDKGLIDIDGRPMIELLLRSVADFIDDVVISTNQNLGEYSNYGLVVKDDDTYGSTGPLAGICSAIPQCQHERILICCCDMPVLPGALIKALLDTPEETISVCSIDGRKQLLMVIHREMLGSLVSAVQGEDRRFMAWLRTQRAMEVPWEPSGHTLLNVNTPDDLDTLRRGLSSSP